VEGILYADRYGVELHGEVDVRQRCAPLTEEALFSERRSVRDGA
jgi:hypothetical protein